MLKKWRNFRETTTLVLVLLNNSSRKGGYVAPTRAATDAVTGVTLTQNENGEITDNPQIFLMDEQNERIYSLQIKTILAVGEHYGKFNNGRCGSR